MLIFVRSTASVFRALSLAAGVLILVACEQLANDWRRVTDRISSNDSANLKKPKIGLAQFPDLPMPSGAEININETLVFGGNQWFGQLALETSDNADKMFEFYRHALPQHQWQEITSVRARISVLTYVNGKRVLSITIRDTTLGGADVILTVSPLEASSPPA